MKKIVYVTGCLGFIGYRLTQRCLEEGWYVIGVDKITYAANPDYLKQLTNNRFKFIQADINDLEFLYDCDFVINTAAESHVDNSINSSKVFLQSNINGVHNLLELIKQKSSLSRPTFVQISTDEVYGDIIEGSHKETDILNPSNPYSASKAAADMLVCSWARTYGLKYLIIRPTNNYGIGQYVEKLIPKTCKNILLGKKIDLHDHGLPKRTWLNVNDTVEAILLLINSNQENQIYNVNGNYECRNIDVVRKIVQLITGAEEPYDYVNYCTRPGQDLRYSLDDSKIKTLGWQPKADFDKELFNIVKYNSSNFIW
jgi:dTDP-glucose 4,6-dehydratase